MDFSLMFWGDLASNNKPPIYDLLLKASKHADDNGYFAIWIPERHFHAFGGEYPNPAVLAAAVAASTKRIRIRAGSVVMSYQRYVKSASLVGTSATCRPIIEKLRSMEIDELCCLIDFGVPHDQVMKSLEYLTLFRRSLRPQGRRLS